MAVTAAVPADTVARAVAVAHSAAGRAGVEMRALEGAAVQHVQGVIRSIWGDEQVMAEPLLRALTHAGTTCVGAFDGDRCVGVAIGFLGWRDGLHLHSHITAVVPGRIGGGIGRALKLEQRAVCLRQGVQEARWTYDPLIARNAHFNLVTLGGVIHRFLPDHYGQMQDAVNENDRSDRFEVRWDMASTRVEAALAGALTFEQGGTVVPIPADYERLRQLDPAQAKRVRERARDRFVRLLAGGAIATWSPGEGAYRFRPGGIDGRA